MLAAGKNHHGRVRYYMRSSAGLVCVSLAALLGASIISAQTLSNQSLSGKFFFRYVSIGSDSSGNATDPRSLLGALTFDGNGNYSFTGQEVIGAAAAAASPTGTGVRSVDPAGNVTMDSPI